MIKLLPKSKYPAEMHYLLAEHTSTFYEQFIIGSKRKTSSLKEKLFENDSEHFVSDSIFNRLEFDYSSSETLHSQQIKYRAISLVNVYFWRSD